MIISRDKHTTQRVVMHTQHTNWFINYSPTQGRRKQFDIGPANPFFFPSLPPIHFLLSPFVVIRPWFFPPLSIFPLPSIFASLSLEVGALNPARGSGAEPQRKSNLVHFSIKIWRLTAYILLESTHVFENWYNANIKILACQIIGTAAAGSAGPVPTALLQPAQSRAVHLTR